jgi:hypothetical protein
VWVQSAQQEHKEHYDGAMSADELGITICLYAYSNLSFGTESQFTDTFAQQYHWLRDYALDHDEAGAIFRAVD